MKISLYIAAALAFIGPVAAWAYLVALACGYQLNSPNCGVGLGDYLDRDFLTLAALPWLIGIASVFIAFRIR